MLDVVADDVSVATDASVPRSSDTRAALKYLEASGANAISITTGSDGTVIAVGYKADSVAAFWLPADKARGVAARARKLAGDAVDVETVVAALHEAAVHHQVRLIEHSVAISRGAEMAHRLDALMDALKRNGMLREFTKAYKRRRLAAKERGEGFMSFPVAELRLRRALIPLLMSGGKPAAQSIFAEVFGK